MTKIVSIVMPLYNEEKYVRDCLDSLLLQDYPLDDMEWIFVDGYSTDNTKKILEEYQTQYPDLIKIFDNPNKTVPYAMNVGIQKAEGQYVIRLDAHATYASNYISRCIYYLETTDADNVGGTIETKSRGGIGNSIALMLSSKFGVGNSQFRTNGENGYVDTVPFGAFRKEVFTKYGRYDERLTRNEDNELNYRIRKNGGKIYLANDINVAYYCRDTVKGIVNMAVANGKWNMIAMKLCPGSMGIRHFIPLLFVLSIIGLGVLGAIHLPFWWFLGCEAILYTSLNVIFSAKQATRLIEFFQLLILFPLFHITYGIGSIIGILNLLCGKYPRKFDDKQSNQQG